MKAVGNNWLTIAILSAAIAACGDSSSKSNDGDNTGGNADAGSTGADAGGSGAADAGNTGGALPTRDKCGAQANGLPLDTSKAGGCYYFYCYLTEETLMSQVTEGGACVNDKDLAIACEGESVRKVSACAREKAGVLPSPPLGMGEEEYRKQVTECAREDEKLADLSDACLACNVESSVCAANKCLGACLTGDSKACDECRQKNGCTPDFYKCAGYPDPLK